MSIALDAAIILIVVFCSWRGFKSGIIRGVVGVLALVVSIFAANLVATAYSGEFTGMLRPFVSGVVDNAMQPDTEAAEEEEPEALPENAEEQGETYVSAFSAMRRIGLPVEAAGNIAASVKEGYSGIKQNLSAEITDRLCARIAYIAVFGICFILVAIVFAVIGNLVNFAFSLPGLKLLDSLAGLAFGIAKGAIIVFVVGVIIRYFGLIAQSMIQSTHLLNFVVNNNPIANILGI